MVYTKPASEVFAGTTSAGELRDWSSTDIGIWAEETELAAQTAALGFEGGVHATLASLNTVTPTQLDAGGLVVNDGSNNGVYKWNGSSWTQVLTTLPGIPGPKGDTGDPASDAQIEAIVDGRYATFANAVDQENSDALMTPERTHQAIESRIIDLTEAQTIGTISDELMSGRRFTQAIAQRQASKAELDAGELSTVFPTAITLNGWFDDKFAPFDEAVDVTNEEAVMNPRATSQAIDAKIALRATAETVDSDSTDLISVERWYQIFNNLRAFKLDIDAGLTGTASEKQIVTPNSLIGHIGGRIASFSQAVDATDNVSLMTPLQVRNATLGLEVDRAEVETIPTESRDLVTSRRFHDGFSARRANNVTTNEGTSIDHYITPAQLARVRGIDQAAFLAGDTALSTTLSERLWQINSGGLNPGSFPDAFTSSPLGGTDAPDVGGTSATGARGAVRRFTGASICALRSVYSVADTELYSARVRLTRSTNSSNPSGDAVRITVSWLNPEGVLQASTIVQEWLDLRVADGIQSTTILIGADAATIAQGDVVGVEPPTGAVSFALYVQHFGVDGQTDLEVLRVLPIAREASNISIEQNVTQSVTVATDTLTNVAASVSGADVAITADVPATPGFAIDEGRTVRMQIPAGGEGLGGAYTLQLGALDAHPIVSSDGSALLADTFVAGELVNLTFTGSAWRAIGSRVYVDIRNLKNNIRTPVTEFGAIMDSPSSSAVNEAAYQAALDTGAPLHLPAGVIHVSGGLWYGDQANIKGDGKNVSITMLADGASAEILLGDKRHRDNISNHVFGGVLEDFALDGNRDGGATCTALLTPRAWQNQLRNLRIDNSSGFGIWIPANTSNGVTAAEGKTQGSIWDGLDIRDNAGYGIWSENTEANDVFFQGSPTVNGNGDLGMPQIRIGSCGGWKIIGMHLFGTPADYQGSSAVLLDSGRNLIIDACNFDNDKPAGAPGGTLAILEFGAFNMSHIMISNTVMRHEGADEAGNTYYFIVVRGSTGRNQINMNNVAFAAGNNFEGFSNAELEVIHSEGGTLGGIIDAVTFQGITEDQWGDLQEFPQCQTRHNSVGGHGVPTQENPTINSYGGSVPGVVDLDDLSDPTHPLNTTKKVLGTIYTHPINGRKMECLPPLSANSNWTYLGTDEVAVSPR